MYEAADATKHHEIRFQEASLLSKVLVASGEAIWGKNTMVLKDMNSLLFSFSRKKEEN